MLRPITTAAPGANGVRTTPWGVKASSSGAVRPGLIVAVGITPARVERVVMATPFARESM